jgi:tRNA dimethylallyltransferase
MNTPPPDLHDCWFLSGPTASGKTAVALELAERLGAEIISMDSMAVYRGMDIGTAKPTAEEQRRVPHHLIDLVEPDHDFSLAQYVDAAQAAIVAIRSRGRTPLIVGGTPLYLKALLRGIFSGPPADWPLRHELHAFAEAHGNQALYERLQAVDPDSARRLAPADRRRVVRALEVFQITGQSITHLQREFARARPREHCHVFVLNWDRSLLVERIAVRVEAMFQMGLVDEVRTLLERHGELSRTAAQAVGYREVISHLNGTINLHEAIDLVQTNTRQLAKRQMTWFRSLAECQFVAREVGDSPLEIATRLTP